VALSGEEGRDTEVDVQESLSDVSERVECVASGGTRDSRDIIPSVVSLHDTADEDSHDTRHVSPLSEAVASISREEDDDKFVTGMFGEVDLAKKERAQESNSRTNGDGGNGNDHEFTHSTPVVTTSEVFLTSETDEGLIHGNSDSIVKDGLTEDERVKEGITTQLLVTENSQGSNRINGRNQSTERERVKSIIGVNINHTPVSQKVETETNNEGRDSSTNEGKEHDTTNITEEVRSFHRITSFEDDRR